MKAHYELKPINMDQTAKSAARPKGSMGSQNDIMFCSTLKSDKKKLFNLIYSCQYVQNESDYAKIEENERQIQLKRNENRQVDTIQSEDDLVEIEVGPESPKTRNKVTFKKGMKVLSATRPVLEPKLKMTLKDQLPFIPGMLKTDDQIVTPVRNSRELGHELPQKQSTMIQRINMQNHLEELRHQTIEATAKQLNDCLVYEDPKAIQLLYQYNKKYHHEYERMASEVRTEF